LKGAGGQKVVPSIERVDALGELARAARTRWWWRGGGVVVGEWKSVYSRVL
jgi:hypothetical protein